MSKWFAVLLACCFFPGLASAQDELIKDFSTPQVEKFIKDVLKADIQKKTEKNVVEYATPGGQFDIYVLTKEKIVLFRYPFAALKLPLNKVNEWNGRSTFTRALVEDGKVSLVASLDLQG